MRTATNKRIWVYFYYGVFALVAMLFVTQSSPLYPLNFWNDTNVYHTVARCILNGKVLYRDIHDQKGLLMFVMEMPGVLISGNTFFGMYLTEAVAFFFYMLQSRKIVNLFLKSSPIIDILLPVFALTSCSSPFFYFGGTAEELLLPITTYALYIGLRAIRNGRMFTNREAFIIGIICSWVFWTKFNLCGLYLGYIVFVILYSRRCNATGKVLPLAGSFLGGFTAVSLAVIGYFLINDAVRELVDGYFIGNLYLYSAKRSVYAGDTATVGGILLNYAKMIVFNLRYEPLFFAFAGLGAGYLIRTRQKDSLLLTALTYVYAVIGIYGAGFLMEYYIMGLKPFAVFGWIPVLAVIDKALGRLSSRRLAMLLVSYAATMLTATLIVTSPSVFMLGVKKEDCPQFKFAERINTVEDPKIINYGFLDSGFFLAADVLPFNNHYCMASDRDVYVYEPNELISKRAGDFIISRMPYNFPGYELCDYGTLTDIDFRGNIRHLDFFLYELEK
ncbi:MAG: hypothetical protein IJ757_08025 [Clostridiales bacterium]|nr:hypothetical protein [Clostridiales bacterium]